MKIFFTSITLLLFIALTAHSQNTQRPKGTTTSKSGYMEYLPPAYTAQPGKNFPLLISLPGKGENGNGTTQLSRISKTGIFMLIRQKKWPGDREFIVLSPQYEGSDCITSMKINEFINEVVNMYRVDKTKVYLTGYSCGAIGLWNYIGSYPNNNVVAAAVPIAGTGVGAFVKAGCKIQVPIWAFHGTNDRSISPQGSIVPINSINNCPEPNKEAKITLYAGVNHDAWSRTYDGTGGYDIYSWMLQQSTSPGSSSAPAPQTITFDLLPSKRYGDAAFVLTGRASSNLPVSYSSNNNAVATIAGNQVTIKGAGTATITASQAGNSTYGSATSITRTLTVTKATLIAKADNKSRTYASVNPVLTVSYSGFLNGDGPSVVSGVNALTLATTASNSGAYPITLSVGTAANYTITNQAGTLTINKAALIAKANNKTRSYGQVNPAFTISYSGLLNGDGPGVVTGISSSTPATPASNTGNYPINISSGTATNYIVTNQIGILTISKASLTAQADNKQKTYGSVNPALSVSYVGLLNGDSPGVVSGVIVSTTATTSSNAGTYAIALTGGTATNYSLTNQSGTLTVNKASLIAKADDKSRTYGSANPAFTISYTGLLNGDNPNSVSGISISSPATIGSNAGSYPINISSGAATNYIVTNQSGILTISKASLIAQADNKQKTYGSLNPAFTVSYVGLLNGDSPGVLSGVTVSTTATTSSNAGTYLIALTGGTATNYSLTNQSGTLTVNKASLIAKADDKSRTYGSANPVFTISYTGLLNGDNPNSVSGISISSPATIGSNAGSYPITISSGKATNYIITNQSGTLTINKASLIAKADNKSRTYGSANPAFTFSYTGLLNGDGINVVSGLSASTIATQLSNVGSYAITLKAGTATNYTITSQNGTLTINKATLIAKADDKSRTYGAVNPSFTISYNGLLNGDGSNVVSGINASTTATTLSNVGVYPIVFTGGISTNYIITNTSGALTISKASLIAKADDKSRTYGATNPAFTVSYTGLLNSDNANVISGITASCAATVLSNTGAYAITLTPGTASNYTVTNQSGIFTINKAILTAKADNKSKTYGEANPTFTISYSGLLNGDNASVASGINAITTVTSLSNAGTYTITLTPGTATNYVVNTQSGILTISKAILVAKADNKTRAYGQTNPTFTLTYSGFIAGQQSNVISSPPVAATQATVSSNVAGYPILLSGGSATNYSFSFEPGILTIVKADQAISFSSFEPQSIYLSFIALSATSNSGLPISYTSSNPLVATIIGSIVTLKGTGTTTITATQGGDINFNAASNITQSLTITSAKANQTISFSTITDKVAGNAAFSLVASASSGLPVTYTSASSAITLSGATVAINQAGRVSITARQQGDDHFNAAQDITRSFCIKPVKPAISVVPEQDGALLTSLDLTSKHQWLFNNEIIAGATAPTFFAKDPGNYALKIVADDCSSDLSDEYALLITGMEETVSEIKVYPNPAKDVVHLSLPYKSDVFINVADLQGRSIKQINTSEQLVDIAVSDFAAGTYIISVRHASKTKQYQFLKK